MDDDIVTMYKLLNYESVLRLSVQNVLDTWKPETDFVSIMGGLVLVVIQYFYWKAQTILLI